MRILIRKSSEIYEKVIKDNLSNNQLTEKNENKDCSLIICTEYQGIKHIISMT